MDSSEQTVFVIDDDESVRKSLRRLLQASGHRCRLYSSADDFLADHRGDRPGCLILDVRLPGLNGLDLQQQMSDDGWCLPIVFITGHGDIPMSVRAMKKGAVDFLTKPFDGEQLLAAVGRALRRDTVERGRRVEVEDIWRSIRSLTPRERQVFELVVTGLLNKQVAFELDVTEKTVKVHRGRVMQKMGVESLAELVHLAERVGIGLAKR